MINIAIEEISRIEKLISSWDKNSQTSLININAGVKPVKIDLELFELISRSIKVSNLSQGAFDISYASMDKVWYFDRKMTEFPSIEQIKKSVSKIGYKNIVLNKEDSTVFLKLKGMKNWIWCYWKRILQIELKNFKNNVKSGIINASGDLTAWG